VQHKKIKKLLTFIDFKVDMFSKPLQNTQHIARMEAALIHGSFLESTIFRGVAKR
jgi:hypothetical protein